MCTGTVIAGPRQIRVLAAIFGRNISITPHAHPWLTGISLHCKLAFYDHNMLLVRIWFNC